MCEILGDATSKVAEMRQFKDEVMKDVSEIAKAVE